MRGPQGPTPLRARAPPRSYARGANNPLLCAWLAHARASARGAAGFFATSLLANASGNGAAEAAEPPGYPPYALKMAETAKPIRALEALNGGAAGLETVAEAAIDALRARQPLGRYTLGIDARLLRWVVAPLLPPALLCWAQTAQDCGCVGLLRVLRGGSAVV